MVHIYMYMWWCFFALWKVLNLSNRGLMALPDSIKNLRNVTHLYLNDNKLIVPPDELDTLPVSHGMMWGEKFLEIWGPVVTCDLWPPTRSGWTVLIISRILCDFGGRKLSTWHHFGACGNKLTMVELAYHYQLLLFVQPSNARQGLRPQTNQNIRCLKLAFPSLSWSPLPADGGYEINQKRVHFDPCFFSKMMCKRQWWHRSNCNLPKYEINSVFNMQEH